MLASGIQWDLKRDLDQYCLHRSLSSWRFFVWFFFKFSACTEYGKLKPITWMSPFSEWSIVFHMKLMLCRIWHANNWSGGIFESGAGCKFSIANGHDFFFVNFLIKWNFRRVEPRGRERLYCFPLFAHDRLTSHSNESKLCLAWLAVKKGNIYFANYRFSFRKLQILISQTTDSHFANYRFSFRKLHISISFRKLQ